MNCKPGDLAVVVRAPNGAEIRVGSIVRVVEFDGWCFFIDTGAWAQDVWRVEFNGSEFSPLGFEWGIPDSDLRPIRPNDGEDETLQWAGKPQEVTA